MLVADSHDSTDEPLRAALTRARMAELMASAPVPGLGGPAYTVGLLSALDQVLAAPRWKIVEGLSLTGELEAALLGQPGLLGDVLADVVAWHLGGENIDLRSHTSPKDAERFYQQALA
jgi:EAL and modified HD-GYP domain-containing signal transduction protein